MGGWRLWEVQGGPPLVRRARAPLACAPSPPHTTSPPALLAPPCRRRCLTRTVRHSGPCLPGASRWPRRRRGCGEQPQPASQLATPRRLWRRASHPLSAAAAGPSSGSDSKQAKSPACVVGGGGKAPGARPRPPPPTYPAPVGANPSRCPSPHPLASHPPYSAFLAPPPSSSSSNRSSLNSTTTSSSSSSSVFSPV